MNERPPARFYLIGFASLALLCVGLVPTANETSPNLATAASVIGALGMLACAG